MFGRRPSAAEARAPGIDGPRPLAVKTARSHAAPVFLLTPARALSYGCSRMGTLLETATG